MAKGRKPSINRNEVYAIPANVPKNKTEQQRIVSILDQTFADIVKAKELAEKNLQNAQKVFESELEQILSEGSKSWPLVKIDNVCLSIIDCINKTAPSVDYVTPYKMIRTTNIKKGMVNLEDVRYVVKEIYDVWIRRQRPMYGDVLLTREAPVGEVGMLLSDEQVFLGQRLVSYRVDRNKLNNYFLLCAFQSAFMQKQMHSLASGAMVRHIRVPDTKNFLIPIPLEVDYQAMLVNKLNEIKLASSQLISIYQQKIQALDELKQSLLYQTFTGQL